jgi:CheY-like chemotaxis protein
MDVTEKKESERELRRARQQAEDSVKAKEHFLANISHELRTPLNGILGMLRLMQKTNLNSIQREYIDVLSHTSGNLLTIINDILDFAKLESGGYVLEETAFDPALIADTAFQLQLVKSEEKGLVMRHLHEDVEPMPRVIGDQNRLSQILLNLLNNAVKFTNRGEVLLTHRVKSAAGDQVILSFSVRDTGIGIPLAMQERIFESFTQVQASGFGGGGVGLGLTITKGLVERLGGVIRVESTPDVGSIFTVDIPFRKAAREAANTLSKSMPVGLGDLRVLVVEDNKVNLFITESMLQAWGLSVDVVLNGEDAVRLAAENNYDLILMDIQMPVMDGLEATRQIRQFRNRARASVPVIAVTANTSRLAHRNLIKEGMNDCLVKPFREDQLFRKILSNVNRDSLLSRTFPKRRFPQRKSPSAKTKSLYDLSLLMRDDPGNEVFLRRMLSIFIETIPAAVTSMEDYFQAGDWEMVSTLAHKIKPTLDGTGIVSTRDMIRNIESFREKKRTTDQLGEDIKALKKIIDEVVRSFKKEVDRIQT